MQSGSCRRRLFILLIFLLIVRLESVASHIVGGEIYLNHIDVNRYTLGLNLYFDKAHGIPGALDDYILLAFIDKETNNIVDTFILSIRDSYMLQPPVTSCSKVEKSTELIKYYKNISLNHNKYNNQHGYYIVWQRCCRNETIINIIDPVNTGSVYYTEIPPLKKHINSTPNFSDAQEIFLCTGTPSTFDFNATDNDGDSLVYELTTPFNYTILSPIGEYDIHTKPFKYIEWANGFSEQQQIPEFFILNSKTGQLNLIPAYPGIYSISVVCKEYRNNVYLGQVIREYQILVAQCSVSTAKPQTKLIATINNQEREIKEGDTLNLNNYDNTCYKLLISDTTPGNKTIFLTSESFDNIPYHSPKIILLKGKTDTAKVDLCHDRCSNYYNSFNYLIIENVNFCENPAIDTLGFYVDKESESATIKISPDPAKITMVQDSLYVFGITATGSNFSKLFWVKPFYGIKTIMGFNEGESTISGLLYYYARCAYNTTFNEQIAVRDTNCSFPRFTYYYYSINYSNKIDKNKWLTFENQMYYPGDTIITSLNNTKCFTIAYKNIFSNAATTTYSISAGYSGITLTPESNSYDQQKEVKVKGCLNLCNNTSKVISTNIQARGISYCLGNSVNENFRLYVKNTDIIKPLTLDIFPDITEQTIEVDSSFTFLLTATGTLTNNFKFKATAANGLTTTLTPLLKNDSVATASLVIKGSCDKVSNTTYRLSMEAQDFYCSAITISGKNVNIRVIDSRSIDFKDIPNIFTPNNDGKNDHFEIKNLPPDNCEDLFKDFRIYNRWGKEIYVQNTRDIFWNGDNIPEGIYYFIINYTKSSHKGFLMVMR